MGARIRRRLGLDGNPLRRTADRVQIWATLVLLALLVVAGPVLAWRTGRHVYRQGTVAERVESAQRTATPAVLLQDAPYPASNYAMVVAPMVTAEARWTARDGSVHSGQIPVPAGTPAGTTVTVWTDPAGDPVGRPPRHDDTTARAILAGLAAGLGAVLLLDTARRVLRWVLDRRRLAAWQAAWAVVGPQWTGGG
jgi:hypothetical protein